MSRSQHSVEQQERQALAKSVRVGGLCRVEKFDAATMTVDVQPLSKALDGGTYRTPPQVLGVPVSLVRGGGFVFRPVYAAGDVGVLLYIDHDIDRIVEAGQESQPNTERNHSGDDAVFVGAFVPASNPVSGLPEGALVMATEGGGVYIAITPGGIQIKGDITLDGGMNASGDVTAQGKSLVSHQHPGDSGGQTGPPA